MQVVRAFDSCFVATYKMFGGKQQNVSNSAEILDFAFFFYWVDIVAALDYSGALADLGWRGRNVIFIGSETGVRVDFPKWRARRSAL
jgi:hypothetical protein